MQSQNFTTSCPAPVEDGFLSLLPVVGPLVGIALLLWLKRGPRDAQDVLGSAIEPPAASAIRRLLDASGGWLLAVLVLLLPAWVTAIINAAMFFRAEEELLPLRDWVLEPSWGWSAAAVLACSACFIYWLRTSTSSERDVLRVRAGA